MRKVTIIDPPSGWKYGWPKEVPNNWQEENFDLRKYFLDNGYPEKDIEFALKHSICWIQNG